MDDRIRVGGILIVQTLLRDTKDKKLGRAMIPQELKGYGTKMISLSDKYHRFLGWISYSLH